jgi:hypothetical protein
MAREDGIRASKDILRIIKPLTLHEGITCLVFVLSYIYATNENMQPIEDCADEIKSEFLKNYKNFENKTPPTPTARIQDNEEKDGREGFDKVYDRICRELRCIIEGEPEEPSIKALQALLSYCISLNNPNDFEDEIKIMAEKMIDTIRQTAHIRKLLMRIEGEEGKNG